MLKTALSDTDTTEAACRIMEYFKSQDIYIKYILTDENLIKQAYTCITEIDKLNKDCLVS